MPNFINATNITPPRVALIDERTGLISREWYRFFLNLFTLTGGGANQTTLVDLQLGPPPVVGEDINGFVIDIEALKQQPTQESALDQIAELEKQINALASTPVNDIQELVAQIWKTLQALEVVPRVELGTLAALQQDNVPWLTFNTAPSPVPTAVGSMYWDGGTTMGIQATTNVLIRVGEAEYVYAKASSAITKGQLCYHTGAVGASGVITVAPTPLALTDPNQIVGVAAETIALNGFGLIQISGDLRGFNTTGSSVGETWADGDPLYYNPAYVGSFTKTKPSAPNQKTYLGEVTNAGSGASGSIHIRIVPGSILGGTDSNVQFGTLANNDLIQYDSALQYWKNVAPSSISIGTATNLAGGAAGSVPYQTAPGTTSFVGIGTALQVLKVNAGATAPEWVSGAALTKTDDTNVTLTLGGTPTTSLLAATSLTLGWTGQLAISRGGTGVNTTPANGQLLIGNGTGYTVANLTAGSGVTISNSAGGVTIAATGTGGTVTSVGLSMPTQFTVTNSPVTSSGTLTASWNNQTANYVFAGPTTGAAAAPTFRALVSGDIPALSYVSSVGATAPITSTGGLTPTIGVTSAALTKSDDTNVTLTLGGSPTTALLAATSLTLGWTGQLAVSRGGTGLSSFTSGGILYASGTGTLATGSGLTTDGVNVSQIGTSPLLTLQDNASANNSRLLLQAQSSAVYISTTYSGSSIPMIFSLAGTSTGAEVFRLTPAGAINVTGLTASKVVFTNASKDLTSTGTVGVDQGGTGAATFTANGVLYGSGTSALGVTAAGSTGQVLVGNTSAAPSWSNATSVAVTSISFGTTGLTPNSATQGTVTVAGTLVAGNGGTGQSSYTVGDLLYATGATALSKLGIGTSTTILTSSGTAPQWSAASGVTVGTATNLAGGVAGSVPYQTAAGTTTMLGIGASGRWLGSSGTAPQWNAPAALTKTDDTNVTLTLGGSASSALLNAASLTLGWTGTLAVARGGIGTGTAGITAFNNITGYTAAGATGTTSTNLVFSTSPTLTTPKATTTIGVGNATAAASGAGITFPATDSASSDVNTLDDYEEGTWTPNDASGAGLTFTAKSGMYTKIGRVVYWQALVVYPTTASGLDSLIGGFPFASYGGPGAEGRSGSTITATDETTLVQSLLVETTPQLRFYKAGFVRNTNAELSGNTVYFAGFYVVS